MIRLLGAALCLMVASAVAQARQASGLSGFALNNIVAVDGSTLSLQRVNGGVLRTISSGGADRKTIFRLLHDGLGTVSEVDRTEHVTGLFLLGPNSIATEYTDGRSETLALDQAGGASMMLTAPDGETTCMRWYAAGHRFTVEERQAELAAYARRLGVRDPRYAARPDNCPAPANTRAPAPQPIPVQQKPAGTDTLNAITAQLLALYARKQPAVIDGLSDGFENFYVNFLAAHEGGYTADDGNGSPANFGINQGANPDIDVASLTQADAKQLLHDRYWVASGADRLPPELAAIHGDTAINMGVRTANELLALSDGDPGRYLELRDARYRAIAEANPDKAEYLPLWLARNRDLRDFGARDETPTSEEGPGL